jgi:hypothetical protein
MDKIIEPFKMKIDNQVQGIDIISILTCCGYGLDRSFSFPFEYILFKGEEKFLTMSNGYRWEKYGALPTISYEDFHKKYNSLILRL